jgi:hypothetical protein
VFDAEKRFLNRKLVLDTINWEDRPVISQVLSPAMPDLEAKKIHGNLRDMLARKAGLLLDKMVFLVDVKSQQGFKRVVVNVKLLRDKFVDEIDGWAGGGGHGLNPLRTDPSSVKRR